MWRLLLCWTLLWLPTSPTSRRTCDLWGSVIVLSLQACVFKCNGASPAITLSNTLDLWAGPEALLTLLTIVQITGWGGETQELCWWSREGGDGQIRCFDCVTSYVKQKKHLFIYLSITCLYIDIQFINFPIFSPLWILCSRLTSNKINTHRVSIWSSKQTSG